MTLSEYIGIQRGNATALAAKLGVSLSYLSQLASGKAPVSPERCTAIEQSTDGAVTRKDLRPEDWARIWPELEAQ